MHEHLGADAYPAGLPNVTAAGGTTLTAASGGDSARGFSESAWSLNSDGWGGASGCDLQEPKPSYQTDMGCTGRSYADLSADADPDTGLLIYDSGNGGWAQYGGTSLASPLIAAYEAVTGVTGLQPGLGLQRQRPAQRPEHRLGRDLSRRDPLHLQRRRRL